MKKSDSTLGLVYAAMFGALTAAGAYIAIPIPPVPITMQNLFAFLSAALLGGRLAALGQIIYILLGVMGLPVFAGGKAGFGVLMGPTGGYLAGYVAGAFVSGIMIEKKALPRFAWMAFSMAAGAAVILLIGMVRLAFFLDIGLQKAFMLGVAPFVPGDVLKIAVAAFVAGKLKPKLRL
ncbi:MAG: biotin transporter BioY [Syntrophales bacterium]|nr:biotin transporter BioY [Syntrophales bacterium]MDD5233045.1 biotin transporter BioY [Syntrophales bacterium]MDD5532577.1 biotin transporter BioY [Syntrophales bacterium]